MGAWRQLNHGDISGLDFPMQNVGAATEAALLGFRRLRMSLSMIGGRAGKNIFLPAGGGRDRRAVVRSAIQLIAADLRESQIA